MSGATIHHVTGDATQLIGTGTRVIVRFATVGYSIGVVYLGSDVYEATVNAPTNEALESSLSVLREWAQDRETPATVHMAKGEDWAEAEPIVQRALSGCEIYVYELEAGR